MTYLQFPRAIDRALILIKTVFVVLLPDRES